MRMAVVDGTTVVNIIEAEPGFEFPEKLVLPAGDAGIGWTYENGEFAPPTPAPPTADDVIAERERRLALGFDYDFGDERGVHHIGTAPNDIRKWMDEVTPLSQAFLNVSQPDGEITIITDTGPAAVTALEWQQILLAAAAWRQPIYQASFVLQAMDPIPTDYADDKWW